MPKPARISHSAGAGVGEMNLNEAVNLLSGLRNRGPKFSISIPDISIINKITHQTRRQLGERKLNKTRGNKGAEQVPRTIILSFTCCCHRTGSKGGVQGAVTPAISVTLPADEVVLPWLACEPVLPLPSIFSPMLICGLKFLQNFWLFSLFFF